MKKESHRHCKGFTLIEVLVALLFASIILPAVMKGVSIATRTASSAIRRAEATNLARNMIATFASAPTLFSVEEGGFEDHPEYRWRATLLDWNPADAGIEAIPESLKELEIEVFWDSRETEDSVSLTTLIRQE